MQNSQLNPVEAMVALLLLVFSPEAAKIIGPYAVIILSATTGAAWSLGRRQPTERNGALFFICKIIFTACLITVALAVLLTGYFKLNIDITWLLAPIGLLIGGVGEDWNDLIKWVWSKVKNNIPGLKSDVQGATGDDNAQR